MKQPTTPLIESCSQWLAYHNAFHPDDLTPEERARLNAHLDGCERCRTVTQQYAAINALLLGLPRARPLPALPARVQEVMNAHTEARADDGSPLPLRRGAASSATRRQHSLRGKLNLAAAVLVVAALLGGYLLLFQMRQPTTGGKAIGGSFSLLTTTAHGKFTNHLFSADSGISHIVWQRQLDSALFGYGYATHDNGTFYIPAHDGDVYALRDRDGQIVWHTNFGFSKAQQADGEQSVNVMIYQNTVIANVDHGSYNIDDMYGLNAQTGAVVWHTSGLCGSSYPSRCDAQGPITQLVNGVVYALSPNDVSAWNAMDGHFLWRNSGLSQSRSVVEMQGKDYIANPDEVNVLDASTGHFLHRVIPPLEPSDVGGGVFGLAADDNAVYILGGGSVAAYQASDDALLWTRALSYHMNSSIMVIKSGIYVNGQNIRWGGGMNSSPLPPVTSDVYALRPDDGQVLWHRVVALYTKEPPVELNGIICFDSPQEVNALRISDGALLWHQSETEYDIALSVA